MTDEETFLVTLRRTGPSWVDGLPPEDQTLWAEHAACMDALVSEGRILLGGPLSDGTTVVLAMSAPSQAGVRDILRTDPWWDTHLVLQAVEPWTTRLRSPGLP